MADIVIAKLSRRLSEVKARLRTFAGWYAAFDYRMNSLRGEQHRQSEIISMLNGRLFEIEREQRKGRPSACPRCNGSGAVHEEIIHG